MEDVGGVDEEVRPQEVAGLARHLLEVGLDLVPRRAPGEVGVATGGSRPCQRPHHRGPGEGLGQEDHVGVGLADLAEQPLPERHRLGVRVVDAEDADAVAHPEPDDAQHLGVDALGVVVEVDRVDVLVLLRRVLRVGDGAVGAGGEELGVLGRPGVVGRGLERQVERDLEPEPVRLGHEGVEVLERAEVGVDGVVAALGRPDRPRGADVVGARVEGVVAALAVDAADGVDRRQVDDVEAHVGHGGQPLRGGAEACR